MQAKDDIVVLQWYCGHYVGNAYWQLRDDWVHEPDECCMEFETQHTQEEIEEEIIGATCPECSAELTFEDDAPEILNKEQE